MKYKEIIKNNINNTLTEVIAGGGNGSIITLCINNSFRLFVSCAWKLTKNNEIITGCHEESSNDFSPMVKGIKRIEGLKLISYSYHSDFDFTIFFEENYQLSIFADNTKRSDIDENWSICDIDNNLNFTLDNNFIISKETYW